jgi:hypothetical protein
MTGVSALIGLATVVTLAMIGLAAAWEWVRRRSTDASPQAMAPALRSVATILIVRAALLALVAIFSGIVASIEDDRFATGFVICAGLAGALTSTYLLMGLLRFGRAARNGWAVLAAFLVTWSVVVESLQGYGAYRAWTTEWKLDDFGWLGDVTILGPLAFLVGTIALTVAIKATVARHRPDAPDVAPATAVRAAIGGMLFTLGVHLPLSEHVGPAVEGPGIAVLIGIVHLGLQLFAVPLLLRAAARLEAAGTVAEARVAS